MIVEKPIFCFHSVRSIESMPPASCWPSQKHYDMFSKHLRVDSDWFVDFLGKAKKYWGDFSITFDDGYIDSAAAAFFAATMGIDTTIFVSFSHMDKQAPLAPLSILRREELGILAEVGVCIGSHGMRHRDWKLIPDATVKRDIFDSFNVCAELYDSLGFEFRKYRIAPPHGSFYPSHVAMCEEIGFNELFGVDDSYTDDFVKNRVLACASGYRVNGEEYCWPWGG